MVPAEYDPSSGAESKCPSTGEKVNEDDAASTLTTVHARFNLVAEASVNPLRSTTHPRTSRRLPEIGV